MCAFLCEYVVRMPVLHACVLGVRTRMVSSLRVCGVCVCFCSGENKVSDPYNRRQGTNANFKRDTSH